MNHVKKYKKVLILLGTACVIYVSFCYILPLVVPFCIGAGICQSFAAVDEKNTYGDTSESESMQCSYGGCKPRCAGVFFILYRIFVHQPARRIYPSSSQAGGSFGASLPRRLWFHRQSACAVKGNQLPVAGGENE